MRCRVVHACAMGVKRVCMRAEVAAVLDRDEDEFAALPAQAAQVIAEEAEPSSQEDGADSGPASGEESSSESDDAGGENEGDGEGEDEGEDEGDASTGVPSLAEIEAKRGAIVRNTQVFSKTPLRRKRPVAGHL